MIDNHLNPSLVNLPSTYHNITESQQPISQSQEIKFQNQVKLRSNPGRSGNSHHTSKTLNFAQQQTKSCYALTENLQQINSSYSNTVDINRFKQKAKSLLVDVKNLPAHLKNLNPGYDEVEIETGSIDLLNDNDTLKHLNDLANLESDLPDFEEPNTLNKNGNTNTDNHKNNNLENNKSVIATTFNNIHKRLNSPAATATHPFNLVNKSLKSGRFSKQSINTSLYNHDLTSNWDESVTIPPTPPDLKINKNNKQCMHSFDSVFLDNNASPKNIETQGKKHFFDNQQVSKLLERANRTFSHTSGGNADLMKIHEKEEISEILDNTSIEESYNYTLPINENLRTTSDF